MIEPISATLLGSLGALSSSLCWATSLILYRKFGHHLSGMQLNFFKNSIGTLGFLILFLFIPFEFTLGNTPDTWLLILSGILGFALADSALLSAVNMVGATIPSAIQCLMIPLAATLAFFIFDENLVFYEYLGALTILIGVVGMIWLSKQKRQHAERFHPRVFWLAIGLSVFSAAGQAVGWIMAKEALVNTPFYEAAFLRIAVTLPVLAILIHYKNQWSAFLMIFRMNRRFLFLVLAGILGTCLGLIFATMGAKLAKIAIVTALLASYPIFVVPLSYVFLRERIGLPIISFVLLTVGGIFVMLLPGM